MNIPIAAGERIYTRFGCRQFLEDRSIQVIQPDVCLCGGITETKKICDMANTYDCAVQVHVCGSSISKAAALQIEAVIVNLLIHEHHQRGSIRRGGRPVCTIISRSMVTLRRPDLPGIGQEQRPEVIERCYTVTVTESKSI